MTVNFVTKYAAARPSAAILSAGSRVPFCCSTTNASDMESHGKDYPLRAKPESISRRNIAVRQSSRGFLSQVPTS